jgi:hypothetical protein
MKIVVLKIFIFIIKIIIIGNISNLRTSSNFNRSKVLFNDDIISNNTISFNHLIDPIQKNVEKINFDFILLNLDIIQEKIDEFKSKLNGIKKYNLK